VLALTALGKTHGVPMRLAEATHAANAEQAVFVANLVAGALGTLRGKRIAFWGLAFKPETDDVRDAPSVKLADALIEQGASVVGHDPEAGANFAKALGGRVKVVDREYDALDGADALVLLTEWLSYRAPSFGEMKRRLVGTRPAIIDARNIWRPADVRKAGMRYVGIGVPTEA
jgi:UDPglucose 6-dehydrogenase